MSLAAPNGIAYAPAQWAAQHVACHGHRHGIDRQFGTNDCCLAPLGVSGRGVSSSAAEATAGARSRSTRPLPAAATEQGEPSRSSASSMRMCGTMHASGRIVRPRRFCSGPLPLDRAYVNKMKGRMLPRDLRWDPEYMHGAVDVRLREIAPTAAAAAPAAAAPPPLSLNGNTQLLRNVQAMANKPVAITEFDDWLPPEERMALRRFATEKSGQVLERLGSTTTTKTAANVNQAQQWWQASAEGLDSSSDDEESATDAGSTVHLDDTATVEWVKSGKKMRCVTTDPLQLSPREKFYGKAHTSGAGICLSAAAFSWLRHENTCIVAVDAGKKGFRSCNILEVIVRKQEHASRFRGQVEMAQRWAEIYAKLTRNSAAQFFEDHNERRRIDLLRHFKEVSLENELRRGGYDPDHGLFDGERELIGSHFTACQIEDLEWIEYGNSVPRRRTASNSGGNSPNSSAPKSPSRLPPLSTPPRPQQQQQHHQQQDASSAPTPGGGNILRSDFGKNNGAAAVATPAQISRDKWNSREHASAHLAKERAAWWAIKEEIEDIHNRGRAVARLLHNVFVKTEFLIVMERRIHMMADAIFEDRRKIETAGPVDDYGDQWTRDNVEFKRLPFPNELDGITSFRAQDLLYLRDAPRTARGTRQLKTWSVYLFLCFGLVIRKVALDDPAMVHIVRDSVTYNNHNKNKTAKQRGCPKPSRAQRRLAARVFKNIFGERDASAPRGWFVSGKKKPPKKLRSQIVIKELEVLRFFEQHFRSFQPQSFRREECEMVHTLLRWHVVMCGGSRTPKQWVPAEERDELDRVAEGMYAWLNAVSSYLKTAKPYWSALNAREPLKASLVALDVQARDAKKRFAHQTLARDAAMDQLRATSQSFAEAHEREHLDAHGGAALWHRRLPGAKGSERVYPELLVRDGNYRFPIPKTWSEPMRATLQTRMDELYRQEAAPWYVHDSHPGHKNSYGNHDHEDHPHRLFRSETKREEELARAERKQAAKHEKDMMRRLLTKSTDQELDDMLHEDHGPNWIDHHVKNVKHGMHHKNLKTVWKWTWVSRVYPLSGMTRHCMLTAGTTPAKLPLAPCAPN